MQVKLSRRNLLSLLHKLEMPGSRRTIVKQLDPARSPLAGPGEIAVVVITDEECYADRDPGQMHPDTEQFVIDLNEALVIVRQRRQGGRCGGCHS